MKPLFSLTFFISLTFMVSCDKRNNTIDKKSMIIGDWTSEKRVAWFTITQANSTEEGIPIGWYQIPPKDTFDFSEERLHFRTDGTLYVEVGNSSINFQSALQPPIRFPKDTLNYYIYTDKNLTLEKKGVTMTFEIVELTAQHMTLYKKAIFPGAIKEDWTYYSK